MIKDNKITVKVEWANGLEVISQKVSFRDVKSLNKRNWDSYSLDQIKILANLNNKSDVEHLIEFLEIHKFTFKK